MEDAASHGALAPRVGRWPSEKKLQTGPGRAARCAGDPEESAPQPCIVFTGVEAYQHECGGAA
jgi:hypothetical protein